MGTALPPRGIRLVHGRPGKRFASFNVNNLDLARYGGATALTELLFVIAGFPPLSILLHYSTGSYRGFATESTSPRSPSALWTSSMLDSRDLRFDIAFLPAYLSTKMNQKQSGLSKPDLLTSSVPGIRCCRAAAISHRTETDHR